jgi:hypothetical protein
MDPPSRFVRRQGRSTPDTSRIDAIQTEIESSSYSNQALERPESPQHNRAKYNRIVGAMVHEQNECTGEDIDLEKLGFHRECIQAIFGPSFGPVNEHHV